MKKQKLVFISVGMMMIILFSGFFKKEIYQCTWQPSAVSINDFHKQCIINYSYDEKSAIYYGVSNNDKYLFVMMKTEDDLVKQKIRMGGVLFSLDTTGKGKEQLSLKFPFQNKPNRPEPDGRNNIKPKGIKKQEKDIAFIEQFNKRYSMGLELIETVGFGCISEPVLGKNINPEGINVVLRMDTTDFLYYEAMIPLNYIFKNPQQFINDPHKNFSFSLMTSVAEPPERGRPGGGPGGKPGGEPGDGNKPPGNGTTGFQGNQGGPPPGGQGSGEMPDMKELTKVTEVSVTKASLASGISDKNQMNN